MKTNWENFPIWIWNSEVYQIFEREQTYSWANKYFWCVLDPKWGDIQKWTEVVCIYIYIGKLLQITKIGN